MKRTFINKVILKGCCSGSRCINKAEVLSNNTSGRQLNRAFTLVELLVVVLIIGILSAVAIPMYQGAVDKSHWSTMLPASKAIKDAEEAFKMTNGEYSDTMEHLDVQINNDDLTFTLNTPNNLADPNVIRVTNSKLDNVRLASYLDDSPKFAGQLHCEAKNEGSTPNERGQRLCEKLLNGQELTQSDGYTGYLLDQAIDKATCDNVGRVWSNKNTKCFLTEKDRCEANGMPYNGFCGYSNKNGEEDNKLPIEEGGTCKTTGWHDSDTCSNLIIYEGGNCDTTGKERSVNNCRNITFKPGSKCIGTGGGYSASCTGDYDNAKAEDCTEGNCQGTFRNNSTCEAKGVHACSGTFESGSICYGKGSGCHGTFKEGSKCVAMSSYETCGNGYFKATYEPGSCCEEGVPGHTYCPSYAPKC